MATLSSATRDSPDSFRTTNSRVVGVEAARPARGRSSRRRAGCARGRPRSGGGSRRPIGRSSAVRGGGRPDCWSPAAPGAPRRGGRRSSDRPAARRSPRRRGSCRPPGRGRSGASPRPGPLGIGPIEARSASRSVSRRTTSWPSQTSKRKARPAVWSSRVSPTPIASRKSGVCFQENSTSRLARAGRPTSPWIVAPSRSVTSCPPSSRHFGPGGPGGAGRLRRRRLAVRPH